MKIAVTSSDGENINSHFGKTDTIYVFDIDNMGIKFLEKRNIEKYSNKDPKHTFRADEFNKVFQAIADCKALYTEQIGNVPAQKCRSLGIDVIQKKGKIVSIIKP